MKLPKIPANWTTTLAGAVLAAMDAYRNGAFTDPLDWRKWLVPVSLATLGYFAKAKNVTGGTVQQDADGKVAVPQGPTPLPPEPALPDPAPVVAKVVKVTRKRPVPVAKPKVQRIRM